MCPEEASVVAAVADGFKVPMHLFWKKTRRREVSHPRFVAFYLLGYRCGMSTRSIGHEFGMDRSTVLHGIRFVKENTALMCVACKVEGVLDMLKERARNT